VVVRVGILGAGWIAADHVAALGKRDGAQVVAVADLDRSRAEALAPEGAGVYESLDAVLDAGIDALWVCVPPLAHREASVAALERGIHVYLEKPIARELDDARAIVAAAEASDAICAVAYQWHATEVLDDLERALEGQQIGLLVGRSIGPTGSRPWFLDRKQGGGNVLERGSHQIDLMRTIAGEVTRVQAAASDVALGQLDGGRGDIEDAATIMLHFESGALGTIVVAWTRAGQPGSYGVDIVATEATLALALDPEFALRGVSRGKEVEACGTQHPFERSIARFLEAVQTSDRSRVVTTPADAARTLAVANACEQALASGETLAVTRP
jgi:predicted dehydrogenase